MAKLKKICSKRYLKWLTRKELWSGADLGFSLGGGAPVRSDVTDR